MVPETVPEVPVAAVHLMLEFDPDSRSVNE
jgi:hypothetical protein